MGVASRPALTLLDARFLRIPSRRLRASPGSTVSSKPQGARLLLLLQVPRVVSRNRFGPALRVAVFPMTLEGQTTLMPTAPFEVAVLPVTVLPSSINSPSTALRKAILPVTVSPPFTLVAKPPTVARIP